MRIVKCRNCGKRFDYEECGCCPECGAYNRPPRRNRIDADGVVHHISDEEFMDSGRQSHRRQGDKVCFEKKVCYEDEGRSEHREADRPNVQMPFTGRRSCPKARGKVVVAIMLIIVLMNMLPVLLTMCDLGEARDIFINANDFFSPVREPDYSTAEPAEKVQLPDNIEQLDIGRTFLWWDEEAVLEEASVMYDDDQIFVDLTVRYNADWPSVPDVCCEAQDGTLLSAQLEYTEELGNGLWHFSYYAEDCQEYGMCVALFDGMGVDWHEAGFFLQ